LENAGGYRLIRNKKAIDSIINYYSWARTAALQLNEYAIGLRSYLDVATRVFDHSMIDTLFFDREKILSNTADYSLLNKERSTIKQLYNRLHWLLLAQKLYLNFLDALKEISRSTLLLLKKEYDLT
jgi:hypothetical protein